MSDWIANLHHRIRPMSRLRETGLRTVLSSYGLQSELSFRGLNLGSAKQSYVVRYGKQSISGSEAVTEVVK